MILRGRRKMAADDCNKHGHGRRKLFKRLCAGLLIFNFLLLLTILLTWAILRPEKPKFVLQDVTVYDFNATVPNFLSSKIQVTIAAHNPNEHLGIYYDRLDVYAIYRSQQITLRTRIPPYYQGHKDSNVWSPVIYGGDVPVAPYNSLTLGQDQAAGSVSILIKIDGRVRWKLSTFITGRYHLYVKCPAFITWGSRSNGVVVGNNGIKYQMVQRCGVSV